MTLFLFGSSSGRNKKTGLHQKQQQNNNKPSSSATSIRNNNNNNKSKASSSLRSSIQEDKMETHDVKLKGGFSNHASGMMNQPTTCTFHHKSLHQEDENSHYKDGHLDHSLEPHVSLTVAPPLNQLLPDINKRPSHALQREDSFETLKSPDHIPPKLVASPANSSSSTTSCSSPLNSPHQQLEELASMRKKSSRMSSTNGDEGHVKSHVLKSMNSVRLLDTFQKMNSTRTLIKQDPAFESKLIEYEEKRPKQELEECKKMVFSQLDEMRKVSPTSIYDSALLSDAAQHKSKHRGSSRVINDDDEASDDEEQEMVYSKREIGKMYAKEIGRESLHLICRVRRNMMKQDSFIQELNRDKNIKEKFERNMSLLKGYGTNKLKVAE
ncbi:hypothetical protein C9374_011683 [Naegleria lovaniensis]|uniref:Uncharacterized protein n=1 Tax=Naegleria lovaniensis TaxID=51637 RepID=A0AA88GF95_NAELO|nr:uncharacterized protein C9374_011683 [Naegleria lovaniensis]KAG2373798.1 hypothetical protein C9374_011683 [Naegleria lovaniensis]